MKQVNIWKCDFCKKTSFHKGTIKKHEENCFHNPETPGCETCKWFSPETEIWSPKYFKNLIQFTCDDKPKLVTQCKEWDYFKPKKETKETVIWDDCCNDKSCLLLPDIKGLF